MRILVTGAGGFIVSCLIEQLLHKGHEVIGIDNGFGRTLDSLIPLQINNNFTFIKGDAGDINLLNSIKNEKQIDITILMHALVGEPLCNKFPNIAWDVNAKHVKIISQIFDNIIFTSTGSVYGKVEDEATETSPTNPVSIYAKSKLLGEEYLKNSNKNYIIYRFATAFGLATSSLRLDLLVNDFCYQAYKNKCLVIYQPEFRRTFCHVRDLADSIAHGIENFDKMKNNLYNVGYTKGNITKKQLAELIASKTHCELFYGQCGYVDPDKRDYESNYDKINKTGWQAKITLEQGIEELLRAMPIIKTQNPYCFI